MSGQKHLVDESARVFCPLRGRDVDVEVCLACARLETHDLDSRRPFIVCRSLERIGRDAALASA